MFYEPTKANHSLPHDPFKACVIPRPIGWISTISTSGIPNLAPYSQFNNLGFDPPMVMFSANQTISCARKDSVVNAEQTGVFCWQLATYELREYVNASAEAVSEGVDEFEHIGLSKVWSEVLSRKVPMVERSPVKFECEYVQTVRLPGNPPMGAIDIVIGKVVGIHIDDWALTNGKLDYGKTQPIARCGYYEYAVIREENKFEMIIPGDKSILYGLEGSIKEHRKDTEKLANGEHPRQVVNGDL